MSSVALEAYLARLYTDATERENFLADPERAALAAGLPQEDSAALCNVDKVGLRMAAARYSTKRQQHRRTKKSPYQLLCDWLSNH